MMKKLITITLLFITFISYSQENKEHRKSHELKINAFNILIFKSVDVSYEYLISGESSVGISFLANLNDKHNDGPDYNETVAITPYYRHFFSRRYAWGFFMESFGMLNIQENDNYDYNSATDSYMRFSNEKTTNFALGIALGGKFVSQRGFIFEFFGGVGRNLFTNDSRYNNEFVPRLGASFGYRF